MARDGLLTPHHRDALLAVVAIGLLVAPLWVPLLHLDDPRYRYEATRIETDGPSIGFATEPADPLVGISDRMACGGERRGRACVFEHYVAANGTVPTGIFASREGGFRDDVLEHRYDYAIVNGTVYEVGAAPNATVTGHGGHRLDLALRPVDAGEALGLVSEDVNDVPPAIRRAARTGGGTGYVEEPPETPIELADGTYRRVYVVNTTYPPDHQRGTETLLTVGLPIAGLGLLAWLRTRIEIDVTVRYAPQE